MSVDGRFILTRRLSEADAEAQPLPVELSPVHHLSALPAPVLSKQVLIPSDRG